MAATWRADNIGGGTAGTSDRTATLTPASGDLWVVLSAVTGNTNDAPTCSDNNSDGLGAYDLIASVPYNSSGDRLMAFVRRALFTNTNSTTVTVASGSNSAGEIVIEAISGMVRAGITAIRQFDVQANGLATNTAAPVFDSAVDTNNLTIAAQANAASSAQSGQEPSGWTERRDVGQANPNTWIEVSTRNSGFTGTTVTWGAASASNFGAIVIELDGSTPPSPTPSKLAATLGLLLLAWQPLAPPAQPARVQIAPTIAVDAPADAPPPQDRRLLNRIVGGWWKPILHGTGGGAVAAAPEGPPPRQDYGRDRVLSSWTLPPTTPQRARTFIPGSSVDAPPVLSVDRTAPARAWQPTPGLPPRAPLLAQGAPTVANDPPFDSRRAPYGPIYSNWKWRPVGSGDARPPDNPPPTTHAGLTPILEQWRPAPPLPQLGARVATLPGVSVDPPPPTGRAALHRIVAAAWEPPAPPQPPGPRAPLPSVDPPQPLGLAGRLATIQTAWLPAPPQSQRAGPLSPGIPGQSVDAPPPLARSSVVLRAWQEMPAPPPRPPLLVPIATAVTNDPPFDARRSAWGPIYAAWKWRPVGSGNSAAPPPSDPPFGRSRLDQRVAEAAWQPAPPQVVSMWRLVFEYAPDDPPFGLGRLQEPIRAAWLPPPPAPQWGRHVPVSAAAVPVDAPPPARLSLQTTIAAAWAPPGPLPPRAPKFLPGSSVDAPPVINAAAAQSRLQAAWAPPPGLPPRAPMLAQEAQATADAPPAGPPSALRIIAAAWTPAQPPPPIIARAPIASVDAPPPTGRAAALAGIATAWLPSPPAAQAGPHVPVSVSAVPEDNPPFGLRTPLWPIVAAWQPGPPMPWRPTWLAQGTEAVADAPPVGLDTHLWAILSTWQPAFVLPPARPVQVQPGVAADAPPITARPWLTGVLARWIPEPPTPIVRIPLAPGIPGQSVDRPAPRPTVQPAWTPPDPPLPIRTRPSVATQPGVSVDAPPPMAWQRLPTILSAWEPGPPRPQWGAHVPVVVSAVPVNDPPFGIRPWLSTVLARCQPGPPQPIVRAVVATESGPSLAIPQLVIGPGSVTTARADDSAVVKAETSGSTVIIARAGPGTVEGG